MVLCGVQTPNCIRATAVDAMGLDYEVTVLSDATASKSEQVQENNLEGELSHPTPPTPSPVSHPFRTTTVRPRICTCHLI